MPYRHQIDHVMRIDVVDYKRIENNFSISIYEVQWNLSHPDFWQTEL